MMMDSNGNGFQLMTKKPTYRPRPVRPVRPVAFLLIGVRKRERFGIRFYTARKDVVGISNDHHAVLPSPCGVNNMGRNKTGLVTVGFLPFQGDCPGPFIAYY